MTQGRVRAARALHAVVALCALAGVGTELVTALVEGPGVAGSTAERLVRLFGYFTVQSNILAGAVAVVLAVRPGHDGRVFRVARLDAVLCIAVTGIVYHAVLRGLQELTPSGAFANLMLHTAVPFLTLVAWLWLGPRPRISWSTVAWSVVYPLVWVAYTLARGAVVGWYPYPFLDVGEIGLGAALVNTAVVALVFLVLATAARWVDHRLGAVPRTISPAGEPAGSAVGRTR